MSTLLFKKSLVDAKIYQLKVFSWSISNGRLVVKLQKWSNTIKLNDNNFYFIGVR